MEKIDLNNGFYKEYKNLLYKALYYYYYDKCDFPIGDAKDYANKVLEKLKGELNDKS